MLEKQRTHELTIEATRYNKENEKYLDALLVTYMNEIGTLFMNNNGSLTASPIIATPVRLKTLTIARQLDPSRNTQLVKFLYEASQLTNGQNPLDLSGAQFDGINLDSIAQHLQMRRLSLFGAHLNNASFRRLDLSNANFSQAHLKGVSFVGTYFEHVDFSHAILLEADFERSSISYALFDNANMVRAKFSLTDVWDSQFTKTNMGQIIIQNTTSFRNCHFTAVSGLISANLSNIKISTSKFEDVDLRKVIFVGATIVNTHFNNTNFDESDFSRSDCRGNHFRNIKLNKAAFTRASLSGTIWTRSVLKNIDLTGSKLKATDFSGAITLENLSFVEANAQEVIFSNTELKTSDFSRCQCNKAVFVKTKISDVSFDNAKLNYANFSTSIIDETVNFYKIDGFEIDFSKSTVTGCNFAQARLTNGSFAWAVADATNFTDADVNGIDFSHTSLHEAQITQKQLDIVMSLSGAYFNKKNNRNPNLVMDSGYECNTTTMINRTFWQVTPHKTTPVSISQMIDVSRYRRLIDKDRARCYTLANVWNNSAAFYITTFTRISVSRNYSFQVPESPGFQTLQPTFILPPGTTHLLLIVIFKMATSRCDYIDLSLQDDYTIP
ncbi:unnamed protein product [Rotaria magnacalcarata]